ncbi:uncharacterized protein LOC132312815 isoform X2 [Cornus florida]|uniref:uncharacterized protein LOC132312815 isoform X2 n=1 Tax=Cornus florida TaxID=4283 RepID=UPI002898ADD2|nr:uncharacterized protein LOC132312815 isoform X2 [Cornus florida]
MLCSISTAKSGSNWLDRLRSSKGFPAGDDLDLDQFLNHPNPNLSNSSETNVSNSNPSNIDPKSNSNSTESDGRPVLECKKTTEIPKQNGEQEWRVTSNVLAELFNMGESDDFSKINGKKSSRKQPNPKICVLSTSNSAEDEKCSDHFGRDEGVSAALPSSGDNSCSQVKQMSDQTRKGNFDVEEEKSHVDLSAFSRTEVTVIDTSCPSWKFEKLLFRRKNVWKVRDKKSKSANMGRKKRKVSPANENFDGEKRPKHAIVQCSSAKEANGQECLEPSLEGHLLVDNTEAAHNETPDTVNEFPKKRFPRKSKREGSSVILIKSIPTSKKNGATVPKSRLLLTQR